jgi:hypothetical protein
MYAHNLFLLATMIVGALILFAIVIVGTLILLANCWPLANRVIRRVVMDAWFEYVIHRWACCAEVRYLMRRDEHGSGLGGLWLWIGFRVRAYAVERHVQVFYLVDQLVRRPHLTRRGH